MAPLLYKMDSSPPANAVRMLADIIGLDLDFKDMDFVAKDHKKPDFIKLNPMGTIPTLKDDDGFVISESHTIMKYLLTKYGGAKAESLYPSDVRTRAFVDQCMFFNTGVFFIKLKVIALPALFGNSVGPTDKDREDIDASYGVLEAYLSDHKFVAADHLTIADLSLGATAISLQCMHKLDPARFPRVANWMSRLEQESFVKKILLPGAQQLQAALNIFWQKNRDSQ